MDPENYTPGNIIAKWKNRAIVYGALAFVGLGLTGANAGVAYAISQGAIDGYPLWLGIAGAVYAPVASALFGVAMANPTKVPAASVDAPVEPVEPTDVSGGGD